MSRPSSSVPRTRGAPGPTDPPSGGPVVVLCSTGFVFRNYLLGGFLDRLLGEREVVVVSALAGDQDFVRTMSARGVSVVAPPEADGPSRRFRMLRDLLHAASVDTDTWRLKLFDPEHHPETRWRRTRKRVLYVGARVAAAAGVLRWMDRAEARRVLDTDGGRAYRALLEGLGAGLVFSPAPLLTEERLPIQVAGALGIPTAVSVLSWDNLSSKSRLPVPATGYLVWGRTMRDELLAYYPGIDPDQVRIVGAPQFDFHRDEALAASRAEFFGELGLDPERPLVVYAGVTPSLMPREEVLVEAVIAAVRDGAVHGRPQVVVRLHPKDDGSRYRGLRNRYPAVRFSVPGQASGGALDRWTPDRDDVRTLSNLARHGDVHLNVCSTMTIDAAIFDRPVINPRFDLAGEDTGGSWGLRTYEYTHYQPVLASGGVRQTWSVEETILAMNAYLDDPTLDRAGRRRLVEIVCDRVDGHAGTRAAEAVIEFSKERDSVKRVAGTREAR